MSNWTRDGNQHLEDFAFSPRRIRVFAVRGKTSVIGDKLCKENAKVGTLLKKR